MRWDQIESQWNEFAVLARAHWSKLTDDWTAMTGARGHLIGRIQKRSAITRGEADRQAEQWSDALLDSAEASTTY